MLKIGILAPQSKVVPGLARDYRMSFELGMAESGLDYQVQMEPAGFNASANSVRNPLARLLLQEQVDVVLAPLNPTAAVDLQESLEEYETPLIITTLGENLLPANVSSPYIFTNAYHLWQSAWLSGYLCGQKTGQRIVQITSFRDGGYGIPSAFQLGVEAAGSELHCVLVAPRGSEQDDLERLLEHQLPENIDHLVAHFSGQEALGFVKAYQQLDNPPKLTCMASMVDTLQALAHDLTEDELGMLEGLESFSSWNNEQENSQAFQQHFYKQAGRFPNPYFMLAYETGRLLGEAMQDTSSGNLVEKLSTVSAEGPRGNHSLQSPTNYFSQQATFYHRQCCKISKENQSPLENRCLQKLTLPSVCVEDMKKACQEGFDRGWLNPYLIM